MKPIGSLLVAVVLVSIHSLLPSQSDAFTYVQADRDPEVVVHPIGYTGKGGVLTITLGLHPDFADMEDEVAFSAEHAAAIWTSLLVSDQNLGPSIEVPRLGGTDFFGTLIHEIGHVMGLAHPTLVADGLATSPGQGKYTSSLPGPNGKFDLDHGVDGVRGTADDRRGDDVNVVFFKKSDNHPFVLPESDVIDSTTYSRDLADLPAGDFSPNVGSREVASEIFAIPRTEAMMVGGGSLISGRVRRGLAAEDVAGLRYAMSGVDEIQGTADDYTIEVRYVGVSDRAHILMRFDKPTGFASAGIRSKPLSGHHRVIVNRRVISYNRKLPGKRSWYFPQPEPTQFEPRALDPGTLSVVVATEKGTRYAVTWPASFLGEGDRPSEILVTCHGETRGPISGRLFLFEATGPSTTVQLAFPSDRANPNEVSAFKLTARTEN